MTRLDSVQISLQPFSAASAYIPLDWLKSPAFEVTELPMIDACGYLAAVLVALAFYMKSMVTLRLLALGSNAAFIVYGVGLGLTPVWVLHCCLVPLNLARLFQAVAPGRSNVPTSGPNRPIEERSSFAPLSLLKGW